ncbi:MAG: hypothetical protein KIH08_17340, partial [Candidatus Freyarchaeota archaeon]|nr:hypothetical protein [Candidatus Jordarchaeia archaeon]
MSEEKLKLKLSEVEETIVKAIEKGFEKIVPKIQISTTEQKGEIITTEQKRESTTPAQWLEHAENCPECQKILLQAGWVKKDASEKEIEKTKKQYEDQIKNIRDKYAPLQC